MEDNPYKATQADTEPRHVPRHWPLGEIAALGWFLTIMFAFFFSAVTVAGTAEEAMTFYKRVWGITLVGLAICVAITVAWFRQRRRQ